jgi:Cu(I)/Ag(I) efflux system membrane fusion protein
MSDNNYDPLDYEPIPEEKEGPPPLTHTMSIVRWTILIGLSLFAISMILSAVGLAPWEARADDSVQYHCPMHPTYISNQPGDCPICGMTLVPIDKSGKEIKEESKEIKTASAVPEAKAQAKSADKKAEAAREETAAIQYTCPMHPDVLSDKPGKCPECGMSLVQVKNETAAKAPEKARMEMAVIKYVCPMNEEFVSDKPGTCPKCGMDLVKKTVMEPVKAESAASIKSGNDQSKETKQDSKAVAIYTCPMHPEVVSNEPGKCPKCGMLLKKVEAPKSESTPKSAPTDEKKDLKSMPEMNKDGHSSTTNDMGEAPVPGLVPVTIEPARQQLIGVRTGYVERRNLGGTTDIVGTVTPDESRMKNMNTRVKGWVVDLYVDKTGQYVEAGQPLLSIYSQELYQAGQDFMVARDALMRGSSDEALTDMRNQIYFAAKERLRLLGLSDDQITDIENSHMPSSQLILKSPFSGYVLDKSVLPGQYLTPNQNLLTIADLSHVWVLGDVYEQDIANIHEGQKAIMHLAAFPGEDFAGTIGYIYPSLSEQTRTLKVRLEFANPSNRIRPGMYAEISLRGNGKPTLAVPSDAILDGGDQQYAFVIHDGTHFEPRLVRTGRTSDDYVEILSGLHEGEQVVTSANFLIDSESKLKAAVSGMSSMPNMPDMQDDNQEKAAAE